MKAEEINVENLKVGDTVCIPCGTERGWYFMGRKWSKEEVTRITPKKTKVVTNTGEYATNHTEFYKYDPEMDRETSDTNARLKICWNGYEKLFEANKIRRIKNPIKVLELMEEVKKEIEG